jgi:hypothetical protein
MIKHINILRSEDGKTHVIEIIFKTKTSVIDFLKVLNNASTDLINNPENIDKIINDDNNIVEVVRPDLH